VNGEWRNGALSVPPFTIHHSRIMILEFYRKPHPPNRLDQGGLALIVEFTA
jgi:hypothetical protein